MSIMYLLCGQENTSIYLIINRSFSPLYEIGGSNAKVFLELAGEVLGIVKAKPFGSL
jgi:hypothetical protein